ncbi:hypothetical protein [Streptomyces sp. NBC_00091]|uniref:hypothetical protein n=1 Tax=Streptomyces sp. NBC_00091 TaxID=2975648 RepID=UPI002250257F|nr:hypothetical protein [Streptomyces sp. NBC_00091]MCX5380207.1 hypothetical protein [Streptomyces sp. NBC_00091]MCX5380926.1 hypothetical protein [Streptomyces sp. NBC_00091]
MELLHAHHGGPGAPEYGHGLQTAALLRRSHPYDKELQVAGLVHGLGPLLSAGGHDAAEAVRPLLGDRVARLVRLHAPAGGGDADAEALRQAAQAGRAAGLDAGVVEDWRPVLELVAAGAYGI